MIHKETKKREHYRYIANEKKNETKEIWQVINKEIGNIFLSSLLYGNKNNEYF
jgi:hypothetical protein